MVNISTTNAINVEANESKRRAADWEGEKAREREDQTGTSCFFFSSANNPKALNFVIISGFFSVYLFSLADCKPSKIGYMYLCIAKCKHISRNTNSV